MALPSSEVPPARSIDVPAPRRARAIARLKSIGAPARDFRSILRFRPFDTSTPEGRSKERYRRAALSTFVSVLARGIGLFTGLAWIRLSLAYLGKERYGLWIAVNSIVSWVALADLGLGRGIQNYLSEANGRDDRELGARYLSTGVAALVTLAIALATISIPLLLFVPWAQVLNVRDPGIAQESTNVVATVLGCFLVQFPLCVVPAIYAAYQRGHVAAIFTGATSLLTLAALALGTRFGLQLPSLVLLTSGTGIGLLLVNFALAVREMPWLAPRLRYVSLATVRSLGRTSAAMFAFQIGTLLVAETQTLIIARRLGLSQVAEWSVLMKVYLLLPILIQMIDVPLLPALREAHVRGEREWLGTAFWRLVKIKSVIAAAGCVLYLFFGNIVASLIGGEGFHFDPRIWTACGVSLLVTVWVQSFNDLLIAVNRLRPLVALVLIDGVVTTTLGYLVAPSLGLFGVILVRPAFSLLLSAWLLPVICREWVQRRPA